MARCAARHRPCVRPSRLVHQGPCSPFRGAITMVRNAFIAAGVVLAMSSACWAQLNPAQTSPADAARRASGIPGGVAPDMPARVPGGASTDPRRFPSGALDNSRLGTTGGVDVNSPVGDTTSGNPPALGGNVGRIPGIPASGAVTGGGRTTLPDVGGGTTGGGMPGGTTLGGPGPAGNGNLGAPMGGPSSVAPPR